VTTTVRGVATGPRWMGATTAVMHGTTARARSAGCRFRRCRRSRLGSSARSTSSPGLWAGSGPRGPRSPSPRPRSATARRPQRAARVCPRLRRWACRLRRASNHSPVPRRHHSRSGYEYDFPTFVYFRFWLHAHIMRQHPHIPQSPPPFLTQPNPPPLPYPHSGRRHLRRGAPAGSRRSSGCRSTRSRT
jgi:hypothetical protein